MVLAPIFTLWLGLGIWSKVALGVTLVFFIVFFNVYQGVKEVSPTVLANARMLGLSERQLTRHVYWPSALSWMFSSLHTAVGFAVVGAVVGKSRRGGWPWLSHPASRRRIRRRRCFCRYVCACRLRDCDRRDRHRDREPPAGLAAGGGQRWACAASTGPWPILAPKRACLKVSRNKGGIHVRENFPATRCHVCRPRIVVGPRAGAVQSDNRRRWRHLPRYLPTVLAERLGNTRRPGSMSNSINFKGGSADLSPR